MYVCIYDHQIAALYIDRYGCQSRSRGELNIKILCIFFRCPHSRRRLCSAVSSCPTSARSLSTPRLHLVLTHEFHSFLPLSPTAFIHAVNRNCVSMTFTAETRVYRNRTNSPQGIVPVTGAAYSGNPMEYFLCDPFFQQPLLLLTVLYC